MLNLNLIVLIVARVCKPNLFWIVTICAMLLIIGATPLSPYAQFEPDSFDYSLCMQA